MSGRRAQAYVTGVLGNTYANSILPIKGENAGNEADLCEIEQYTRLYGYGF